MNKSMTSNEVLKFIEPFVKEFGFTLLHRRGNKDFTDDTYLYMFVDNSNIGITINPNDKSFMFEFIVDFNIRLKSDIFSPIDYKDHFRRNYLNFKRIVTAKFQ